VPVPSPTVRGRLTAIVLSAFVLLFSLQPALATSIQTDLWVYNNGDTVTVSGEGFGPDESVNLTTTDPNGTVVDQGTAQSDPIGGFTYAFTLNATVGGIYDVLAVGDPSGLSASTQFDPPMPQLSPTSHAFPSTSVGATSAAFTFTLLNQAGAQKLNINAVQFSGTHPSNFAVTAATDPAGKSLNATESLTFDVVFTPSAGGARSATLTVKSNGPDVSATLTGTGAVAADSTPPVITPSVSGTLGNNGWYV
jgi:hypothetical protein